MSDMRGLPKSLPTGERLLWQGAPRWQSVACSVLHVRGLAAYFAALLVWYAITRVNAGMAAGDVVAATLRLTAVAAAPIALLTLYAWLTARTTTYTVTNRRVVMRFGIALPMTLNLPFSKIDGAALKAGPNDTGDIALVPSSRENLAYPLLWPHARPWRITRTEPALRAIPNASRVAQIVARSLAAAASVPVQPSPEAHAEAKPQGNRAAAHA